MCALLRTLHPNLPNTSVTYETAIPLPLRGDFYMRLPSVRLGLDFVSSKSRPHCAVHELTASTTPRSSRASALRPPKVTASYYPGIRDQRSIAEASMTILILISTHPPESQWKSPNISDTTRSYSIHISALSSSRKYNSIYIRKSRRKSNICGHNRYTRTTVSGRFTRYHTCRSKGVEDDLLYGRTAVKNLGRQRQQLTNVVEHLE
jgi:hypothetical protein